ncbi:hypothetical protein L5515_017379 [Caenorhabditis briggsae]|uniref:Uncharacterized protein n=1 Tax=Caenorhabditis briggsae TaxID=6238 RepID=A0AAE9JQ09_CAEBR|nr:hypothetical protein L5515_017379 [Caenorhabditis briggsae]
MANRAVPPLCMFSGEVLLFSNSSIILQEGNYKKAIRQQEVPVPGSQENLCPSAKKIKEKHEKSLEKNLEDHMKKCQSTSDIFNLNRMRTNMLIMEVFWHIGTTVVIAGAPTIDRTGFNLFLEYREHVRIGKVMNYLHAKTAPLDPLGQQ